MTRHAVENRVHIAAPAADVWRALVDPYVTERWMGGFRVSSTWEEGAEIAFAGTLDGEPTVERGVILACAEGRRLVYAQWIGFLGESRTEATRAVVTFALEPVEGGTSLSVRHEYPVGDGVGEHVAYFWGVAIEVIRQLVEAGDAGTGTSTST